MKLYARLESERAAKAQGGNKYIIIELFYGSVEDSRRFGDLRYFPEGEDLVLYFEDREIQRVKFPGISGGDILAVSSGKGEKQKGENDYIACMWCGKSPTLGKYAQYCSDKCKREALGQKSA